MKLELIPKQYRSQFGVSPQLKKHIESQKA